MEEKYSIEVIEMMCGSEVDSNAQVTSPVSVEEYGQSGQEYELPNEVIYNEEKPAKERKEAIMQTNAATNWLLVGIMVLLFMFMIFKCE